MIARGEALGVSASEANDLFKGEASVTKPPLCICIKNPFSERDMSRMGIAALETRFEVHVFDCTPWLMPKAFDTRGESAARPKNYHRVHSLREFRAALVGMNGGMAIDFVGQFSVGAVLMFEALRAHGMRLIAIDSGAYPSPELTLRKRGVFEKLVGAIRHGGLRLHINARIIRLMLKLLPDQRPDFALVAGASWRCDQRFVSAKRQIPAHSFDYETYRTVGHEPRYCNRDYAVYLDENIAGHEDNAELGLADPATAGRFYPALCRFFDAFEQRAGLPVIIAGYPTADTDRGATCFGGREVVTGRTALLIRDAMLVFAHASTAISFAVLWRRPIVFLSSGEIAASWYEPWIEAPRRILASPRADIDGKFADDFQDSWMSLDDERYADYEVTYIRAADAQDASLWDMIPGGGI